MRPPRQLAAIARASAALAALAGCPARPSPTTPATTGADTRTFGPLEARADARAPGQAVILGTDARGGSTLLRLAARGERVVRAPSVRLGPPPSGLMSEVALTVEANPTGVPYVGVFEDTIAGAGRQWRAGVWIAAAVAADALGKDLTDLRFSAASRGHVDGASASALMAVGMLAALTGATLDEHVTLSGALGPDGTIGPVDGLVEKLDAALAVGVRTFGVPVGQLRVPVVGASAGAAPVDLVARARARGAAVVELADVHAAYRLLTGADLPRPLPLAAAELALGPAVTAALEAGIGRWQAELRASWPTVLAVEQRGGSGRALVGLARAAQTEARQAEVLAAAGHTTSAYHRHLSAAMIARAVVVADGIMATFVGGDVAGARATLATAAAEARAVAGGLAALTAAPPTTLGDHLRLVSAFGRGLHGYIFVQYAQARVTRADEVLAAQADVAAVQRHTAAVIDEVAAAVVPAALTLSRSLAGARAASDTLIIEAEASVAYQCVAPEIHRVASAISAAAQAEVAYFDAIVIGPSAKAAGLDEDEARVRYATVNPDYLVAILGSDPDALGSTGEALEAAWGARSPAWALFGLAGAQLSSLHASTLLARHVILAVETEADSDTARAVRDPAALAAMTRGAEQAARRAARSARIASGAVPVQARLDYASGQVLSTGDLEDQLAAISAYWRASMWSRLAVVLAKH
ncbi:MAG: hypothetical protein KBG28_23870 [Kofleriaceae bacterium]|nr:hypothetical protein [Kofleriaceae bacterium]